MAVNTDAPLKLEYSTYEPASVAVDGIVGPVTWQALVSGMLSG
jgi:peptidoglycan hydrolase-like protein with peptidoglycan-binding domain